MGQPVRIFDPQDSAPAPSPEKAPPLPEKEHFARVPERALADPNLSDAAVRVLGALLCGCWSETTTIVRSDASLAALSARSDRAVRRSLDELAQAGYISRTTSRNGGRAFEITFRLAGQKCPPHPDSSVRPHRTEVSGRTGQKCPAAPDRSVRPPLKNREREKGDAGPARREDAGPSGADPEEEMTPKQLEFWTEQAKAGEKTAWGRIALKILAEWDAGQQKTGRGLPLASAPAAGQVPGPSEAIVPQNLTGVNMPPPESEQATGGIRTLNPRFTKAEVRQPSDTKPLPNQANFPGINNPEEA